MDAILLFLSSGDDLLVAKSAFQVLAPIRSDGAHKILEELLVPRSNGLLIEILS